MKRLFYIVGLISLLLLAGCKGNDEEPPPDPTQLLETAADKIRSANTFRLEAKHSGVDYFVDVYIGNNPAQVAFRRAIGQYVAEDLLQATVNVIAGSLPLQIEIFANGPDQWVKLPGTSWVDIDFAPGFDPITLISMDTGFQAALSALTELNYIGRTSLEDGTGVYHLSGNANGPDVTNLLVGLIEASGIVPVDVFIDRETGYPIRLVIKQPETDPVDPTTWTIDVYDINDDPALTPPDGAE